MESLNYLLMVRNIELFMQLCDSANLGNANHKANITASHSSTLLKKFEVYGLLKFKEKIGRKIFYCATDKGKLVYNHLSEIRSIINEQRPIGEFFT
jgi:hypothetical protein